MTPMTLAPAGVAYRASQMLATVARTDAPTHLRGQCPRCSVLLLSNRDGTPVLSVKRCQLSLP
jgi:hypothetical protein